jgi:hypothetical protein
VLLFLANVQHFFIGFKFFYLPEDFPKNHAVPTRIGVTISAAHSVAAIVLRSYWKNAAY